MTAVLSMETAAAELRSVAPDVLVENELNPRRGVVGAGPGGKDRFDELVASVQQSGVLEPILAFERDHVDGTLGRELVVLAGHRRRAAAIAARCATVDVLVRPEPPASEQLMMMLIENGHRDDLAPIEEARAYATLIEQGVAQKDIAIRCGRSEGHVSKRLAIVQKLPDKVLDRFDAGELSLEVAYQLTRVDDKKLVDKWTKSPTLNEKWLLNDIDLELKKQAARDADAKAQSKLEADGVRYVDRKKVLNGQALVLVGNSKPTWEEYSAKVTWVALTIDDHQAESCHAATTTPKGKVVWVCDDPGAHKKVKRRQYAGYYGEPEYPKTVDDVINAGAKSSSTNGSAPKVEPPKVDAAVAAAYEAARVRAVERRDAVAALFKQIDPSPLADVAPLVDVVALAGVALNPLAARSARPVAEEVAAHVLGIDGFTPEARAKSFTSMFAKQRLKLAAALAVAAFESVIFDVQGDAPATESEYSLPYYGADQWTDPLPFAIAKAYLAWLELAGIKPGPLEKAWLASCKEAEAK